MKHCIKTILCLMAAALAASCQIKEEMEYVTIKTPLSVVLTTRTSVDIEPIVNSVRLFIYQDGVCKANRLFGSSDISIARSSVDLDSYDISINGEFDMALGSRCDLYAVLNENGYMSTLSDGSSLSDKLNSITVDKLNLGQFQNVLDMELEYDASVAASTAEQAFVMLCYAKDVAIIPTTPLDPVIVRMTDDGAARRSMSMLRLAKITSEAPPSKTATDLDLLSRIFVLDVKLVNVPDGYYLTSGSATGTEGVSEITIGSAGANGYYERVWPGTASETVNGRFSKKETMDARVYRVLSNEGNGCWAIASFSQALIFNSMTDEKRYTANNGNAATFIKTEVDTYFNSHSVEGDPVLDDLTRGGLVLSPTAWNIALNQTLYIPERITSAENQSTGFLVRLALSEPEIDMSAIPMSFWNSRISAWTGEKEYYSGEEKVEWRSGDNTRSYLSRYAKSCWADDADKIDVIGSPNGYKFFIGNLYRMKYGTISNTTIDPATNPDAILNWNVPTTGSRVIDVFVPINDQDIDSDYSVRRNQKYDVTLHVMKSTYDKFSTRASNDNPIPVTVTATINKVSENQ